MSTQLKLRRGTTTQHSTFTGAEGEITVDTTKDTVVVHDGATAGGFPLAKESGSALSPTSVTLSSGTANGVAYLNGSKVLTTGSALTFDGTNLGVGIASPLQVIHASATNPRILAASTGTGYSVSQFTNTSGNSFFGRDNAAGSFFGIPNGTAVFSSSNDPIGFYLGANEQMRLTSTGLGIGTSSPAMKLHVLGNSYLNGIAYFGSNYQGTLYDDGSTTARIRSEAALAFMTGGGYERMRLDSSGNLGLGVTPSAWGSTNKAFQFGMAASISSRVYGPGIYVSNNVYFSGEPGSSASNGNYIVTGAASTYLQYGGQHAWYTAPSGTAGNAISFTQAMTLDASGNFAVGSPSSAFYSGSYVNAFFGNANGGAIAAGTTSSKNATISGDGTNAYIGTEAAGATILKTSATERMRIDSSGNVGIGTSNPASLLNIASTADNGNPTFRISGGTGTGANVGQIDFYSNSGGAVVSSLKTTRDSGNGNGALAFYTASTGTNAERMRIDSSGNLLVGRTSAGLNNGTGVTIDSGSIQAESSTTSYINRHTSDGAVWIFRRQNTDVGSISVTASATAYNTSSDYRLKENIQPMQNALGVVAQLNPVTYTWKADGSDGQGFIAHELQAVVPDCVTGEKDAVDEEGNPVYQGIDTSFLVATLTKAIQEQQQLIEALTARVAQLEGK